MSEVAVAMTWGETVPEWRPGVVYWKPTSDGREIGVYAEIFGSGKLYRGPLGDDSGFDEAWRYHSVLEAIAVAREWDGESREPPGDADEVLGWGVHEGQSAWHPRCHAHGCQKQLHGGEHCAGGECAVRRTAAQ